MSHVCHPLYFSFCFLSSFISLNKNFADVQIELKLVEKVIQFLPIFDTFTCLDESFEMKYVWPFCIETSNLWPPYRPWKMEASNLDISASTRSCFFWDFCPMPVQVFFVFLPLYPKIGSKSTFKLFANRSILIRTVQLFKITKNRFCNFTNQSHLYKGRTSGHALFLLAWTVRLA